MIRFAYIVDDDAAVRASLHKLFMAGSAAIVSSFSSGDHFLAEADNLDPGIVLRRPGG